MEHQDTFNNLNSEGIELETNLPNQHDYTEELTGAAITVLYSLKLKEAIWLSLVGSSKVLRILYRIKNITAPKGRQEHLTIKHGLELMLNNLANRQLNTAIMPAVYGESPHSRIHMSLSLWKLSQFTIVLLLGKFQYIRLTSYWRYGFITYAWSCWYLCQN